MISHHHQTIFVHIPKCGGQSVETMFLDDLGLDWNSRAELLLRPNNDPGKGPPRLAHLLARDYVRFGYISQEHFDRYFKFTVIRNPYGRVLSIFNYLNLRHSRNLYFKEFVPRRFARILSRGKFMSLDHFFTSWLPNTFSRANEKQRNSRFWFVRNQADYVFDAEGAPLLDQIIKLENLGEKVGDLRVRCNLRSDLRYVNKSKARVTRKDLLPKHLDVIEELYREDFEAFGYERLRR